MNKIRPIVHIISQIVAQSAIIAIIPGGYEKYFAAGVAIIGVLVAYYDTTPAQ